MSTFNCNTVRIIVNGYSNLSSFADKLLILYGLRKSFVAGDLLIQLKISQIFTLANPFVG